ncbi:MAG: DUF4038 domain-containing protein [Sedimentisphaerales bacterium]|nr:DUF4038 domain-containing protein [Sedimentisphaerales bacterium]
MKHFAVVSLIFIFSYMSLAGCAPLKPLRISPDRRGFITDDGKPFFYLADTGWTAITRLTDVEMDRYLDDRAAKKFTVIQVILVPWDGAKGNLFGDKPFIDNDESQPNEKYFERADLFLDKVAQRGMYPAVVPFWLSNRHNPAPEDANRLPAYARFLGNRYKDRELIWFLGADAPGDPWGKIFAEFAAELRKSSGRHDWLMTQHPEGGGSSARLFHNAEWLNFNGLQSGHTLEARHYDLVTQAWNRIPPKPVVDLEPAYEHIVNRLTEATPDARLVGDWDIRRQAYQAVFAGAAGHGYGCSEIYEFFTPEREKVRWVVGTHWYEALDFAGSGQLQFLRALMESFPMQGRVPDQSLIGGPDENDAEKHRMAIRSANGDHILIYLPQGGTVEFDLPQAPQAEWQLQWYDPRTGQYQSADNSGNGRWKSPTEGVKQDWVFVAKKIIEIAG